MTTPPHRATFRVALLVIVVVVVEGGARAVIGLMGPRIGDPRPTHAIYAEQSGHIERFLSDSPTMREAHDPLLGWRYRTGFVDELNHISAQGLRSTREYTPAPPAGVTRIAAFGDSFVFCNDVADAEAWPAILDTMAPHVEVLNFGVGGYGTDQALLRYEREGTAFNPDVVLIGFAPVNLRRTVNVYRRFIGTAREGPWFKPRFRLTGAGNLELLPNPTADPAVLREFLADPSAVRRLGVHDQWYSPAIYENPAYDYSAAVRVVTQLGIRINQRYLDPNRLLRAGQYNTESEAFRIQMALFVRFIDTVRAAGADPRIVILPDIVSIRRARHGQSTVFDPLLEALTEAHLPVIDLTDAFRAAESTGPLQNWFTPELHYSVVGNTIVAEYLAQLFPTWTPSAAPGSAPVSKAEPPPPDLALDPGGS